MSQPQKSKGKRPPLRDRVAALEPKHGYCPLCREPVHNKGAHAEACRGVDPREGRVFSGEYQCRRCLGTSRHGGICWCGGRRFPVFFPVGSPGARRVSAQEGGP